MKEYNPTIWLISPLKAEFDLKTTYTKLDHASFYIIPLYNKRPKDEE